MIKSSIFHSTGSNKAVVLTGAKGSNRITLNMWIARSAFDAKILLCCHGVHWLLTVLTANPGHSLLHDKPNVDNTCSRPWSVNISMVYYEGWLWFLKTRLPRGSCIFSLETLCWRVIFEQTPTMFTSQNCWLVLKTRKYKNKSQKIGMFQKPNCHQKDKIFEKYEGFKKIKNLASISKTLGSIWKLYEVSQKVRCIENKTSVRKSKQVSWHKILLKVNKCLEKNLLQKYKVPKNWWSNVKMNWVFLLLMARHIFMWVW